MISLFLSVNIEGFTNAIKRLKNNLGRYSLVYSINNIDTSILLTKLTMQKKKGG